MQTTVETLKLAIDDINSIKSGMEYVGIDVSTDPVSTYENKIKSLKTQLDQVNDLQNQVESLTEQNTSLNTQVTEDNSNFDNIYNAIVDKGQTPTKDDRSTYASAIENIETGGGTGAEIHNAYYLFYQNVRTDQMEELLALCKNVTNWNECFYQANIAKDLVIDMTSITTNDKTGLFNDARISSDSLELTFTINANKFWLYAFKNLNVNSTKGLINIIVNDAGQPITLREAFRYSKNIKSVQINGDLSKVTNLNYMFDAFNQNCTKAGIMEVLDMSNWGLDYSKITGFFQAFSYTSFKQIIFGDTKPTLGDGQKGAMFKQSTKLEEIGLNIVENGTSFQGSDNISALFSGCTALTKVEADSAWVIKSGNPDYLFQNCKKLVQVPAIEWKVTGDRNNSLTGAYQNCVLLEEVSITIDNTAKKVLYLQDMFNGCTALKYIRGNLDLSYLYNYGNIFKGCTSLITIETSGAFGLNSTNALTLDLSSCAVFDIASFIESLAENTTGKVRTLKLHATVYSGLTDETKALATSKNYTLASA